MTHVSTKRIASSIAAAAAALIAGLTAAQAGGRLPVAAVTIYPGDTIRENMLTDHDFPEQTATTGFIDRRTDIVGKVAKRTLLPGMAIAPNAIGLPKVVAIGSMVKLVFQEGGLTISTYASALQAGSIGDIVSVRNLESGLTLTGVIAPDGSIHVSNG